MHITSCGVVNYVSQGWTVAGVDGAGGWMECSGWVSGWMDGWTGRQIDERIRNAIEFHLNPHLHGSRWGRRSRRRRKEWVSNTSRDVGQYECMHVHWMMYCTIIGERGGY